jgi:transcriptional regulator with XRE-family HTH domain
MSVADLIRGLGGPSKLSAVIGCTASAVSQWRSGGVPREHHLTLWRLALAAGLPWEPPGADAIRAQLAAPPPDKQEAA